MKFLVLHNVSADHFFGYRPGHQLVKVAEIEATDVEAAFHLLNVGDDPAFGEPDPQAVAYRAARNRSLSVGDVLVADGAAVACASMGWEKVTVDPAQLSDIAVYGSTPLGREPVPS